LPDFCSLVAALQENVKNISKFDYERKYVKSLNAHWLLHTEAFSTKCLAVADETNL
jgi:hypothetical protein